MIAKENPITMNFPILESDCSISKFLLLCIPTNEASILFVACHQVIFFNMIKSPTDKIS